MTSHKNTPQDTPIILPEITLGRLRIKIVGTSPLVMHRWSDKAISMIVQKQSKAAKMAKEARDPKADYAQSLYILDEQPGDRDRVANDDLAGLRFGFPAVGFKAAAVSACRFSDLKMTQARGAFHVLGEMVEINGSPKMRQDMVRIGMGTADIRYRAEFSEWSAEIDILHNVSVFSISQIVNLFNVAGFGVGIGEHRPEKSGSWGMFRVE